MEINKIILFIIPVIVFAHIIYSIYYNIKQSKNSFTKEISQYFKQKKITITTLEKNLPVINNLTIKPIGLVGSFTMNKYYTKKILVQNNKNQETTCYFVTIKTNPYFGISIEKIKKQKDY